MKDKTLHIIYNVIEVITLIIMVVAAIQGITDLFTASSTVIGYVKSMWV